MAVQSATSRIQYAGNNSTTTSYAVPFVFLENSHLQAIARTSAGVESTVTLTNHTGAGDVNGGTVRTSVAVPVASTLTIFRVVPATQTTQYQEGGDFPAASHERALDKLTQIAQQLKRGVENSVRLSETTPLNPIPVPSSANPHVLTTVNGGTPTWETVPSVSTALNIPALTDATTVNAADELIIQQSGLPRRATANEFLNGTGAVTATGSTTGRTLTDRFADVVNVKDFGAVGDGVTDDTAAIQAAVNTNKTVYFPEGTYKTNTTITGIARMLSASAVFTGSSPIDTYPTFGGGALKTYAKGSNNSFVGIAHNNLPPLTLSFPCGVTGYARNDNAQNYVYGVYAESRQYATSGVVVSEIDSFQHGGPSSPSLPPQLAFGTTENHAIALQLGADGDYDNSIGLHITSGGISPQRFLTGIYINHNSVKSYGLLIDSTSTSTHVPFVAKHAVSTIGILVRGEGTPVANNAWINYTDGANNDVFSVKQDGRLAFSTSVIQTAVGAAGGAAAPPSNPEGYLKLLIGNFTKLIPYYSP